MLTVILLQIVMLSRY